MPTWNLFDFEMKDDQLQKCTDKLERYSDPQMLAKWFKSNYLPLTSAGDHSVDQNIASDENHGFYLFHGE